MQRFIEGGKFVEWLEVCIEPFEVDAKEQGGLRVSDEGDFPSFPSQERLQAADRFLLIELRFHRDCPVKALRLAEGCREKTYRAGSTENSQALRDMRFFDIDRE